MTFAVGSLVRARGREWVVLPESRPDEKLYVLRPLVGTDEEVAGVHAGLEPIEAASFGLPDPQAELGDHRSCSLLRDAVRLGFRSGAGPFRSLAGLDVEPRPYQLVPLLMALRLDPVRLLIADDVGVGKTVESCLIAKELLERGEIRRFTVLCPPHLAEQWQLALRQQFNVESALVLPGTAARLERKARLQADESLFDRYPFTVVSMDYIKSDRRRHAFVQSCPELVIVDEAHGCAAAGVGRSAQRRHELLRDLIKDEERHLLLVTATPHSGKDEAFRSLLGLLDPAFTDFPSDLSGEENRKRREHLARHLVQRRRGDLQSFLGETPFPKREHAELSYSLSPKYRALFDSVVEYCRGSLQEEGLGAREERVRWWSALALLRSLGSSPAAAIATLDNRSGATEAEDAEEADELGRRQVLDMDEESAEGLDVAPGAQAEADAPVDPALKALRKKAAALKPGDDAKLAEAVKLVKTLLKDGFSPIVFCRFIPTVHYLAEALRKELGKSVEVQWVTGELAPEDRELRVQELGAHEKRVLVSTDCLSEGINLQEQLDAVVHYDLAWNPTRHEQREGRVDRFGQKKEVVRTTVFYGKDSPIDGIVLQVLLRKHREIHTSLGISVPVPMDTNTVVEALVQGLLLRSKSDASEVQDAFEFAQPQVTALEEAWAAAEAREKSSRTLYAQRSIKEAEVAEELEAARRALGGPTDLQRFVTTALPRLGASLEPRDEEVWRAGLTELSPLLRRAAGREDLKSLDVAFDRAAHRRAEVLTRTHPFVEALTDHVWSAALDPQVQGGPARRCGVVRTDAVSLMSTVLLLRLRFHLQVESRAGEVQELLAEEAALAGFRGAPGGGDLEWLAEDELEPLLSAQPSGNVMEAAARQSLGAVLEAEAAWRPRLEELAHERGEALLEAHRRVRKAARQRVRSLGVEPHLPVDVLGLFVYLPAPGGSR